eukprot:3633666-Prymnesium_polylepis.1
MASELTTLQDQTETLYGRADVLRRQGDMEGALNLFKECHKLSAGLPSHVQQQANEGRALASMGSTYAMFGVFSPAIVHLKQAITKFDDVGAPNNKRTCLEMLGAAHAELGQHEQAA